MPEPTVYWSQVQSPLMIFTPLIISHRNRNGGAFLAPSLRASRYNKEMTDFVWLQMVYKSKNDSMPHEKLIPKHDLDCRRWLSRTDIMELAFSQTSTNGEISLKAAECSHISDGTFHPLHYIVPDTDIVSFQIPNLSPLAHMSSILAERNGYRTPKARSLAYPEVPNLLFFKSPNVMVSCRPLISLLDRSAKNNL